MNTTKSVLLSFLVGVLVILTAPIWTVYIVGSVWLKLAEEKA